MATLSSLHTHAGRHTRTLGEKAGKHAHAYTVFLDNGAGAPCVVLGAGLNWEMEERKKGMRYE